MAGALLSLGVERLDLFDLDGDRAAALAAFLNARIATGRVVVCTAPSPVTDGVDGIVNATPLGMAAQPQSAIAPDLIEASQWVADIVYFPLET